MSFIYLIQNLYELNPGEAASNEQPVVDVGGGTDQSGASSLTAVALYDYQASEYKLVFLWE